MNHSPARTAPDCADRPHAAANSGSTSPHPYTPLLRTPLVSSHRSGHCRDKSSQSIDPPQDAPEQIPAYGNFGRLERDVAALSDDLGADLDQLLPDRSEERRDGKEWVSTVRA